MEHLLKRPVYTKIVDALRAADFLALRLACWNSCCSAPDDAILAAVFALTRPSLYVCVGDKQYSLEDTLALGRWRRVWALCAASAERLGEAAGIWMHPASTPVSLLRTSKAELVLYSRPYDAEPDGIWDFDRFSGCAVLNVHSHDSSEDNVSALLVLGSGEFMFVRSGQPRGSPGGDPRELSFRIVDIDPTAFCTIATTANTDTRVLIPTAASAATSGTEQVRCLPLWDAAAPYLGTSYGIPEEVRIADDGHASVKSDFLLRHGRHIGQQRWEEAAYVHPSSSALATWMTNKRIESQWSQSVGRLVCSCHRFSSLRSSCLRALSQYHLIEAFAMARAHGGCNIDQAASARLHQPGEMGRPAL